MKVVIEIPNFIYDTLIETGKYGFYRFDAKRAIKNGTPLPRCKDCKYFEYDSGVKVERIPLFVAHETCKRWSGGCKTKEDGYCFLFEPQESEDCN